jgi:retron-type reverse transcriptase
VSIVWEWINQTYSIHARVRINHTPSVNHDVLMSRLARRIKDKRVLRLIRRYLQAGMMSNGLTTARREGTPQGGPLSPLLSNILLDELDKEIRAARSQVLPLRR